MGHWLVSNLIILVNISTGIKKLHSFAGCFVSKHKLIIMADET